MSRPAISDAAYEAMKSWRNDRPVAALMGEFNAGKSTLLNFMLGYEAAPTRITATPLPPTWFTYSETPFSIGMRRDGTQEDVDLSRDDVDFRSEYLIVQNGVDCEALKDRDVIDAPGISDPDLHKDALRFLSRYIDFVVWCSAASQAWRQSEKAAFEKLARAKQEASLLVVTRTDKLRTKKDEQKVLKRVRTEAGPLFHSVVALQTPKAAAVAIDDRTDDADGDWVKTGGHGFYTALSEILERVRGGETGASVAVETPAAETPAPVSKKASKSPKTPDQKVEERENAEELPAELTRQLTEIKTIPGNGQYLRQIDHVLALIECEITHGSPDNLALRECIRIDNDDMEITRLISQIEHEIKAFGGGGPLRLDA